jgi:multimeric flavodoxin WrbA
MKKMKLLAINSSPKPHGTTASLLSIFEKEASKVAEVERVNLYDHPLPFVTGELDLPIQELNPLQQKMVDCDGFVIATPTYWFSAPAILKNFIENLTLLEENGWLLEGKVAGFIVYAPDGGEISVLQNLVLTFNHMGVTIPPYATIFYRGALDDELSKERNPREDITLLAHSMAQQISAQQVKKFTF